MRTNPSAPAGRDGERAMDALRRMVRALRVSAAAVERAAGISGAQLFVLRELAAHPGRSMRDLVTSTLTRQSTVSEVVARLVERGLVERQTAPDDARRAVLTPTPAGRALLKATPRAAQADLVDGLRRLPPASRRALADGLEQWLAAAGLTEVPPTMFFEPRRPASRGSRAGR